MNEKTLNPWLSVWLKPRALVQQIINSDTNPKRLVLLLASLYGISSLLELINIPELRDKFQLPVLLAMAAVLGPIAGIVFVYAFGSLLSFTGKWLGGQASTQNIRVAQTLSYIPGIWVLPLHLFQIALFGKILEFISEESEISEFDLHTPLGLLALGSVIIEAVAGIWMVFLAFICLSEVQGFGFWRAVGNIILAASLVGSAAVIIIIGVIVGLALL